MYLQHQAPPENAAQRIRRRSWFGSPPSEIVTLEPEYNTRKTKSISKGRGGRRDSRLTGAQRGEVVSAVHFCGIILTERGVGTPFPTRVIPHVAVMAFIFSRRSRPLLTT
ncbi:hypothetical protein EYF80_023837 [Liparis tanakae]|uniref:Uncharacterized protein n=1 Tax=Liparis tanakae TaxID=230148 RepID=A0A4Z2HLZ7_9TELE|nr:hypothetical protein EYF80_023837 [Liparis tanakae]